MSIKDTTNYLLTLCIPTSFDRSEALEQLLSTVVSQVDSRVEVVISDNGSKDGTSRILDKFSSENKFIRYSRYQENQGFLINYLTVGRMARGEFIWFIGSDDNLEADSICTVLQMLSENAELDGLLVNHAMYDRNMNFVAKSFMTKFNPATEVTADRKLAFVKYWHYTGFFSACVFRRERWLAAQEILPLEEYPLFAHMVTGGYVLLHARRWGYLSKPCIKYRMGCPLAVSSVGGNYLRIIREIDETGRALRFLTKRKWFMAWRAESISSRLHLKALILQNIENGMPIEKRMALILRLSRYYWWHFHYWVFIAPIFILPKEIIQLIRIIRKRLRGDVGALSPRHDR